MCIFYTLIKLTKFNAIASKELKQFLTEYAFNFHLIIITSQIAINWNALLLSFGSELAISVTRLINRDYR